MDQYKIKCSIGKRGIGTKKKEGDQITPKGKFRIKSILYRKDRIASFKCKIIKIDQETKRISCGIKQMHEDPYKDLEKKYKVNETYKGVVTKCVEYGAFVKLQEGLEGLVHASQISWTNKNVQPSKILSPSQEINVKFVELDPEKKRISLSYKQTLDNPWDTFIKKFHVLWVQCT